MTIWTLLINVDVNQFTVFNFGLLHKLYNDKYYTLHGIELFYGMYMNRMYMYIKLNCGQKWIAEVA